MSHTSTSPAASDPGGHTRPGLAAWKVTVQSAATVPTAMLPSPASTPEGTSTATMGTPRAPASLTRRAHSATGPRSSPDAPVPRRQSTTSCASSHRYSGADAQAHVDAGSLGGRQVQPCIGRQFLGVRRRHHAGHRVAGEVQLTCGGQAVAPVVAATTDDQRVSTRIAFENEPGDPQRGALHQHRAGDADLADGPPVELAHLRGREHGRPQLHSQERERIGRCVPHRLHLLVVRP